MSLVLAAGFAGAYFLVWKGPAEVIDTTKDAGIETANAGYDLFKRAAGDFYQALGFEPKVVIGSKTVHGPAVKRAELVTASKEFQQTYGYQATWGGSTKRLELMGDFTAKAGFAIDDSFSMEIAGDGTVVTLRHRKPEVLSCEMTRIHVLRDEDGWWNRIHPEERESAQNELIRQAREAARGSDLLDAASADLAKRLAPLGKRHSFETRSEVIP